MRLNMSPLTAFTDCRRPDALTTCTILVCCWFPSVPSLFRLCRFIVRRAEIANEYVAATVPPLVALVLSRCVVVYAAAITVRRRGFLAGRGGVRLAGRWLASLAARAIGAQ